MLLSGDPLDIKPYPYLHYRTFAEKSQAVKTKSPDMIIDNEIGEMKSFGFDGKIPTKNTIKSEIKDAGSKQRGRIIYIHITDEVEPEVVLDAVTSEIGRTPIKKVFLEHRGVINEYTRQFFFHRRK